MTQLYDVVLESELEKTDFFLTLAEATCAVQEEQLIKGYIQLEASDFFFQIRVKWQADLSAGGEPFLPDFMPSIFTGAEALDGNGDPLSPQAKEALCRRILSRMDWQKSTRNTFSILRIAAMNGKKTHCAKSYKVRLLSKTFTKTSPNDSLKKT